jgi:hypothetical protein
MRVVSPPSAGDDYQSFLEEYHNINEEGNNRTTVLSRKFDESQEMHTLSDRLADARLIVDDIVSVMKNKNATKKSRNEALKHLKQSIGPLLDVASDLFRKSAHTVAPIAGGGYAHRRMRVSKMKELNIPTKPNPESSLLLVDKFPLSTIITASDSHLNQLSILNTLSLSTAFSVRPRRRI